jgi:phosphotransferase system enzyme I (PtsP)
VHGTRRLLTSLRDMMASGAAPLAQVVRLVAAEMVAEVCSLYALRTGDVLELIATFGLRPDSVGRTRLRMGEGIVGVCAATGTIQNLPDAQMHPSFAYRPETGEEPFASMLAVPVRRSGHTMGVVVVQNRSPRRYPADEVDAMETVAMLLAEALAAAGAGTVSEDALGATLPRQFEGSSLAPGLAVGPIVTAGLNAGPRRFLAKDPVEEQGRLDRALVAMRRDLDNLIERGVPDSDESREVLEATRLVAADDGWVKRVEDAIGSGLTAEAAVVRVASDLRDRMRRITDPYLRERLADLEDLASRLLQALDGRTAPGPVASGSILVVRRLGPVQLLQWHASGIAGVAIEEGSASGHAAILARALGLPTVGAVRGLLDAIGPDDEAVLDGDEGQIILRPDVEVRDNYCRAIEARAARRAGYGRLRLERSVTADGTPFTLMLNVGLVLELEQLDSVGAAGIGLFRTEIAMLARGSVADTADQAALYSRVLDAAGDRPVMFRTLDLGGDKLLPDAPATEEENPAMGWRSLRVGLDRPALLRRQIRALLLAAAGRPLSVMFPMVATVAEFRAARGLLFTEAARVRPAPSELRIGTMLEIPALLWQLPTLLKDCHFLSIGSNDLMQFLFAADRGSPALAGRYDLLSPPVLDILEHVQRCAAEAGVTVSVCGESASRPLEALTFVALGITSLSMPASSLLSTKALLRAVDLGAFRPVLAGLRANATGEASLREPIAAWAREQGLEI